MLLFSLAAVQVSALDALLSWEHRAIDLMTQVGESALYACSSTMAASTVQDQDLIVLARRPQASQRGPPQEAGRSAAADPLQARMQQAMRSRPDGSLEDVQAGLALDASVYSSHR